MAKGWPRYSYASKCKPFELVYQFCLCSFICGVSSGLLYHCHTLSQTDMLAGLI